MSSFDFGGGLSGFEIAQFLRGRIYTMIDVALTSKLGSGQNGKIVNFLQEFLKFFITFLKNMPAILNEVIYLLTEKMFLVVLFIKLV